jgi:hypothetical protein
MYEKRKTSLGLGQLIIVNLLWLTSCATPLMVPEPVAVDNADAQRVAAYSEEPSQPVLRWPMPQASARPATLDASRLSLLNAGNRFTDWRELDPYLGNVQPLFAQRCVSCHACSDSPCQLKLSSYEGVIRGASRVNYYAVRIGEAADPKSSQGIQDFHPVVTANAKRSNQASLLLRLVQQGARNTVEGDPGGRFDLAGLRALQQKYDKTSKFQCPADDKALTRFLSKHPLAGMPFGLPRLRETEIALLQDWVKAGSPGPSPEARARLRAPSDPKIIDAWEQWLNQDSHKSRLFARYLYEHVFATHIHFEEMPGEFYALVRSTIPPGGGDIAEIETSLPTDDPRTSRVYYRLRKITETIASKHHVVWHVDERTRVALDMLFLQARWEVPNDRIELPGYGEGSPFDMFAQIPAVLRHRFMLENSKLIVESMVRSPVCIGRSATYAIADHFWVFFLKPESDVSSGAPFFRLSPETLYALRMDMQRHGLLSEVNRRFNYNQIFINGYERALRKDLETQVARGLRPVAGLGLGDIWDGGGDNPNAWLTVLRHDASATVHYGQEGGLPQSVWVLSYANFERLYYNLVANFKFWGNVQHKLATWQSMGHERLDGEDLFVSFLPEESRAAVRQNYSGGMMLPAQVTASNLGVSPTGNRNDHYIDFYPLQSMGRPALAPMLGKDRADHEFARLIQRRMTPGIRMSDDTMNCRLSDNQNIYVSPMQDKIRIPVIGNFDQWENTLRAITEDRGKGRYAPYLPSITYLRVNSDDNYRLYTLISNRGYLSHNVIFYEDQERDPMRDTISIFRGVVGDYPELFLDVPLERGADFLRRMQDLNADNYRAGLSSLKKDYGIPRNSAKFWPFVDWLHKTLVETGDGYISAGILDLSKYDLYDRN